MSLTKQAGLHGHSPETKVWTITEPDAPLRQAMGRLSVETWSRSFVDITPQAREWLADVAAADGILTVYIRHTSASLTVQESADADVRRDLLDAFDTLAPEGSHYRHSSEGADDMPAHIKAALTDVSLSIPVIDGVLDLGTWQAIYLIEHRGSSHRRVITLAFQGTFSG